MADAVRARAKVVTEKVLVLGAGDVASLLDIGELIDHLASAFINLSAGRASAPPRTAAIAPAGLLGVMPAYVPGMGFVAKLVSVFPANHGHGLPSHQALITVFDEDTGRPVALLDGTVITSLRTAAASALSTRLLQRRGASVFAVLGAGVQGRAHLRALTSAFEPEEIRIASRQPDRARDLAKGDGRARAVDSFEDAVRGADVICCCTDSPTPVLRHAWLRPGAHVTSVGASREGPEVDPTTVAAARLFVESRVAFQPYPAGCHELQGVDPSRGTELGEVLAGSQPGRTSDEEQTLYKSMGHAVEDAAAANLVMLRAKEQSVGTVLRL
jgi:ornithine cyclodeaminase/alanine dehydrogenase-like protein (mu-crystallin family)